jgi:integrase
MAKLGKLTALKVSRIKTPGMYADGGGLYLQVTTNSKNGEPAKSWIYRYMLRGRAREMGLGPLAAFGLQEARARATTARKLRHDGIDPIEARHAERARARLEAAKALTFKECAEKYTAAHRAGWRNTKHAAQWEATLKTYVDPIIGKLPVQAVDTPMVMKVLEQPVRVGPNESASLWTATTETASRLRGRIEVILDWARVRGYREGENPARWRGHLDKLLPARSKVQKVKHHAALPYDELPEFMARLRAQEGVGARALEFAVLTAARTGEVLGARWSEIDFAEKVWTVPATRMKTAKEHRVPLSARAISILGVIKVESIATGLDSDGFIFPGGKLERPLSNMAFLMLLRRMGRRDVTAHGFRSTFRDWAAERTRFPAEVAEMALAHTVGDKVEAAYRRGDLFEKRRRLVTEWARFCDMSTRQTSDNVASMRQAR